MHNAGRVGAHRIGRVARAMPVWGGSGPGRLPTVIWTPIFLLDPVLDIVDRGRGPTAGLLLAAITSCFVATVWCAYGRRRENSGRLVVLFLVAQVVFTTVAAMVYGQHWYVLFTMATLALGALWPPPVALPAVLVLSVAAPTMIWFRESDVTSTWVTGTTMVLAGLSTYSLHRLLSVAAELHATREEMARQAVETERLRFSRDLHDLLGHTMSVIVVKAQAVRRLQDIDPDKATEHVDDIERIGREALSEIREAVGGYRRSDLIGELDRAAMALAAAGVALNVEQPDERLPRHVDEFFAWVVREGVTNVVRHSDADTVVVAVTVGETVRLQIGDDGRGGGGKSLDGSGLRGLRERAVDVQGSLTVSDSPDGFTLIAEVPLWKKTERS